MDPSSPPRILAVEDNSETRLLLQHLLQTSFEVQVVSGVDEALDAVENTAYDVFLLDINLSEQRTGTDLLRLLRDNRSLQTVPAIALTAYAMPGDQETFLEAGFDRYVSKPFTRSDLTSAIKETLRSVES
jgi:CheY-like chemotaxis protein